MSVRWYVSDTHFMHKNIVNFTREDGSRIRPFDSVEEHDEVIIENWNKVVKPNDTVYHLGDVAIPRKGLQQMGKLNGRKILVKGNHDIFKLKDYVEFFEDIRSYLVNPGLPGEGKLIFSHVPVHDTTLDRFGLNVHGHVHDNSVPDPRFFNLCPEKAGFTPIHYDEIMEWANNVY